MASLPLLIQILLLIIWNTVEICPAAAVIWDLPNKSHQLVNAVLLSENSSDYSHWSKAHRHVWKRGLCCPLKGAQMLLGLFRALQGDTERDRDCLQSNRGLLFISTFSFFSNKPVIINNHDCFE